MTAVASTLPEQPRVSLLLPVFNAGEVLDHVLERLAAHTTYPGQVELVAVDDGSTDGSREILRRWRDSGRFGDMVLIEKANAGAIDTLNVALERATGDVVVQLDADASIETPGWLETMLSLLRSDDRVGAITVKVVLDDGLIHACGIDLVTPAGMQDRSTRLTEAPGARTWHFLTKRVHEGEWSGEDETAEVDAGLGCCLMYRREDAVAAGGYDRGYSPVWFDDIDLCLGIRRLGRKVFYLPDVRVTHHVQGRVPQAEPAPARRLAKRIVPRPLVRAVREAQERRRPPEEEFSDEQRARLTRHHAHWERKWGWHPLNPDMTEVRRRWQATELWWREDPGRSSAGREILADWAAGRDRRP